MNLEDGLIETIKGVKMKKSIVLFTAMSMTIFAGPTFAETVRSNIIFANPIAGKTVEGRAYVGFIAKAKIGMRSCVNSKFAFIKKSDVAFNEVFSLGMWAFEKKKKVTIFGECLRIEGVSHVHINRLKIQ